MRVWHLSVAAVVVAVLLATSLAASFATSSVRRDMMAALRVRMDGELRLAERLVARDPSQAPDSLARAIAAFLGHRVTFITPTGQVVGDSYASAGGGPEPPAVEDLPELAGAVRGGVGRDVRYDTRVGAPTAYAAGLTRLRGRPLILRLGAPLDQVSAAVSRTRRAIWTAGLLSALLGIALALLMARMLTRPLDRLTARLRRMAGAHFGEDGGPRPPIVEMGRLAAALDALSGEIAARLTELTRERDEMQGVVEHMAEGVVALTEDARVLRTNRAALELLGIPQPEAYAPIGSLVRQPEIRELLERSVIEPVEAGELEVGERHLLASSRPLAQGGAVTTFLDITEIRRLERVRRDFVANASHELKTPLTSVRGFAETLLDDDPPEALRLQFLEAIRNNTLRMQRLVDDLLDLSRLESGGWVAHPEDLDPAAVARDAWQAFAEEGRRRGMRYEVVGEGRVHADRHALMQIFGNLLENALRHTPDGGAITVRIQARGDLVGIEVADTGEGIPSRALPRIFERFYRADPARDRSLGGTGLGLSIVRHLVRAGGGDVKAESELGRGTTIRFTLPAAG